ncbi:MAG: tripartite tricarboxylate transporter substrate binding protein [Pseudomonadota bacterium]
MQGTRRTFHRYVAAAGLLAAQPASTAWAADAPYPTRPITLIVPFAPGGGNDTVARTIGQTIGGPLGQPVVVDNRPGAGGSLGAGLAARAPADGYTLFLGGVGSHALNPTLNPKLGYDPVKDFAPVAWIASAPMVLAVHPSVPAHSVQELIAYAKKNPGRLNYASNGNGSSSQLAAVIFNSMAGTDMVHVPYKGLSPAMLDLLSGTVQIMFSSSVAIMPSVLNGKLRVLGVTSPQRMPSLPEVPTIAEQGLPGYETGSWYGILAPAGTPADIVERLNREINKALQNPDLRTKLGNEGADPVGGTPRDFAEHIRAEILRIGQYARNIKVD